MLLELFAIPLFRKALAVGLFIAAIAAILFSVYHAGKHAGADGEAGKETEAAHAQFAPILSGLKDQLSAGEQREKNYQELAAKFADLAAAAHSRVQAAAGASTVDAGKVKLLPDTVLKADIESKLGGALEDPIYLRSADAMITDYPHKVEQLAAQSEELVALNSRLTTILSEYDNAKGERDAAIAAFNRVVPLYQQAYNAAIKGHRKWFCLFLCKPKNTMDLPDPVTLAGLAAGAKK